MKSKINKTNNKRKEKVKWKYILQSIIFALLMLIVLVTSLNTVKAAQLKTVEYFIVQNGTQFATGARNSIPFNIYIPESKIRVISAYVEINGVSTGAATLNIEANVSNFAQLRQTNLTSAGETQLFTIRHNSSAFSSLVNGNNIFNLSFVGTGTIVSLQMQKQ